MPNALTGAWNGQEKDDIASWFENVCVNDKACWSCGQHDFSLHDYAMSRQAHLGLGVAAGVTRQMIAVYVCGTCSNTVAYDAANIAFT